MRKVINIFLMIAVSFFVASCASGPGKSKTSKPAATPKSTVVKKIPVRKKRRAARKTSVARKPAPKISCKVRRNVVKWALIKGGCKNGYAHGNGYAKSIDQRRSYRGQFVDGQFYGKGDYDWGNGVRYTGDFEAGKKHGSGTLTYANKSSYSGEFRNNLYHGQGTYIGKNKSRYVGEF